MYRLLASLLETPSLSFPVEIDHRDKPDFKLTINDTIVGAECTQGMPEQYARALSLQRKYCPDAPLDVSLFSRGAPERTNKEILKILNESRDRLSGPGWVGDSVEQEWAEGMLDSVRSKIQDLNHGQFEKFPRNWLLIYDNIPGVALDISKAMTFLMTKLLSTSDVFADVLFRFDSVFIETNNMFLKIALPNWQMIPIKDVWRTEG